MTVFFFGYGVERLKLSFEQWFSAAVKESARVSVKEDIAFVGSVDVRAGFKEFQQDFTHGQVADLEQLIDKSEDLLAQSRRSGGVL